MAKRKRLSAAQPQFLTQAPEGAAPSPAAPAPLSAPPIAQVAGEAAATSALRELSGMMAEARARGMLLQNLPLDQVDAAHLVRDRMVVDDADQAALMESLRTRGQQTPIEVVDRGDGAHPRYGLISGWRRLSALRQLQAGGAGPDTVVAQIRTPDTSSEAYVAMVEENEIRAGLSFYERARIVVKALDEGIYPDAKTALQTLYANVSRAKRSKIKSFMTVVGALDGVLHHPTRIGERLGLALAQALQSDTGAAERLVGALNRPGARDTAETEQQALSGALRAPQPARAAPAPPAAPSAPVPGVAFDAAAGTITLSGPGVTRALADDLGRWLARRQPGKAD